MASIEDYMKDGIQVAIGTDGPSSNNCLSMFREMYLASISSKLKTGDPTSISAEDALKMATVTSANAMGLTDCNCLAEGKKADLIVIDLNKPNMQPVNNIVNNIVYAGSQENVYLTMVNGEILYEAGNFTGNIDVERLYAKVNEIMKKKKELIHTRKE